MVFGFTKAVANAVGGAVTARHTRKAILVAGWVVGLPVPFISTVAAERTIRPVKVQQRASGGCWRTLQGLAEFAVVQSYLSTSQQWGIPKIDALRGLFSGTPGCRPASNPH